MGRSRAVWTGIGVAAAVAAGWLVPNAFRGLGAHRADNEILVWGVRLSPEDKGTVAVVREFERRHPGLKVRLLNMGAGGMNPQKLMTGIVGKVPPDVVMQQAFSNADWASRGAFRPLNDLIERDRGRDPLCPKPSDFYPDVWAECQYGGKTYGIPISGDNRMLYWNRRLFRERAKELRAAGLDPNRPPRTWSETLKYSKVLTQFGPDGQLKVAGFMPNFGNSWLMLYSLQNGAQLISADGRRSQLNTPPVREALEFMGAGYEVVGGIENARKFEATFQSLERDPFFVGEVAMKIDGDWFLGGIARYGPQVDFGVAPPPIPDSKANDPNATRTWSGIWSYVIPRGARNVDGAWEFIKFATSREAKIIDATAQRNWERMRGRMYLPRLQGGPETNQVMYDRFRPNEPRFADALRQHMEMMRYARTRPVTIVGQALWDEHVRAYESYVTGRARAPEALASADRVVQNDLDQFYGKESLPIVPPVVLYTLVGAILAISLGVLAWMAYGPRMGRLARGENRWAYLLLSPWLIGFFFCVAGPMIASLFYSFTQYDVLGAVRWTGVRNYVEMFTLDGENVAKSFKNVIYLAALGVPLSIATSLALALLLNASVRGIAGFRALFYMPSIVPTVASATLWVWILNPDPARGLINHVWAMSLQPLFGWEPPGWLAAEAWAKPALILMGLWGAGGGLLLWLAGLKGVPRSLYEAAELDGAGSARSFWKITLPMLSPILFFSLVMGFIGAMQEFDRVYVMRPVEGSAGPNDSLLVPVFHLFGFAFGRFRMGYASALAWLIFVVIVLLTFLQFRFVGKRVHYEVDR